MWREPSTPPAESSELSSSGRKGFGGLWAVLVSSNKGTNTNDSKFRVNTTGCADSEAPCALHLLDGKMTLLLW